MTRTTEQADADVERVARCGDAGSPLCAACSAPITELAQEPGCGAPLTTPHGAAELADALDYLAKWMQGAMGTMTPDYGEVTGRHFQMMTMCPQPVELAAKFAALKPAAAALRARAPEPVAQTVPAMISESFAVLRDAIRADQRNPETWVKISPEEAGAIRRDMADARNALAAIRQAKGGSDEG